MKKILHILAILLLPPVFLFSQDEKNLGDSVVTQYFPWVEWTLTNTSWEGNPYDLIGAVQFVHEGGDSLFTEMFYAGENTWKFRFSGNLMGSWSFISRSVDPELDGYAGDD